jgi:hypothetical protein
MGNGWGHLLPLRAIANEFIRRGCDISLICRDCEKAAGAFAGMGVAIEQSPAWTLCKTGFSLNYAQNLWGNGYRDAEQFGIHFKWWSDQCRMLKPDFIFTDYAPTALLSAMSLDIPRGAFGTGFTLPPMTVPMPCLHPWLDVPAKALSLSEKIVLGAIREFAPSVTSISGIFQGAGRFLDVFPELDHFEFRPSEKYIGPVLESPTGHELIWPDASGCRVFIYLSAANRCLDDLLDHIKKLGIPALGMIRDLPESDRKSMESPTLRLSSSLVDAQRAASECDIAVTQGGLHTSATMLLSGVRLLICPEQLEQTIFAYQVQKRGLCEFVSFFSEANKVKERFDSVVNSEELGKNAAAFAAKYAGYDSSTTVKEIVRTCLNAV